MIRNFFSAHMAAVYNAVEGVTQLSFATGAISQIGKATIRMEETMGCINSNADKLNLVPAILEPDPNDYNTCCKCHPTGMDHIPATKHA